MEYGILSIIKDEQEYLGEWIEYHLALGISHIYLYEDIGSESHLYITEKYPQVELHSVLDLYETQELKGNAKDRRLRRHYLQIEFIGLAFKRIYLKHEVNFLFAIDTDEFITLEDGIPSIDDAMSRYKDYDAVLLDWRNYNSNGIIDRLDYDGRHIWDIYTEECGSSKFDTDNSKFSKIACNLDKVKESPIIRSVHDVKGHGECKWCKTDMSTTITTSVCHSVIYLRHYITKSFEEYAWKLKVRGMSHLTHRKINEYFEYNPNLLDRKDELLGMVDRIKNKDKVRCIFMSGICGFIGFHTARLLLRRFQGTNIVGIDDMNDQYDVSLKEERLRILQDEFKDRLSFVKGDICDKELVISTFAKYSPQIAIHLAARIGARESIQNPSQYIETNVMGFSNVLEACRLSREDEKRGVRKIIYASSSSVYGNKTNFMSRESDASDKQVTPYGATKKMDETLAQAFSSAYGIPCVGLRLFYVYGEYGVPTMAYYKFVDRMVSGERIELYNVGKNTRDFTYVGDVAECVSRICQDVENGTNMMSEHVIYNIGNSTSVKMSDIVTMLSNSLYTNGLINDKTYGKVRLKGEQIGDIASTLADASKFLNVYGFKPNTPIDVGIERFVKWYKERTSAE